MGRLYKDPLTMRLLAAVKSWLLQLDHRFMAAKLDVEAEMWRLGDGVCRGDGELR